MTIKFFCPNCGELIAFNSKHIGKRARCQKCNQIFIIPSKDNEVPKKVKLEPEMTEPLPGFYKAVFVDIWKIFFDAENITMLAFVIAVVCFKFFLSNSFLCCMNYFSFIVVWGWLLGFYLNIIHETAFGLDKLPEIYLGTSITFLWYIVKPFLLFFITMGVVQLPFIILLKFAHVGGMTSENMWTLEFGLPLLMQLFFVLGLFIFPMAILITAIAQDLTMLRPNYLLVPIFKAPGPYIVTVVLLVCASILEMQTKQFAGLKVETFLSTSCKLMVNLVVQVIAVVAMRSIGLFYRHYKCYLGW